MPRTAPPAYRFNAETIFLTYPQCDLTKETLLVRLHALFEIKEYVVAEEKHADGSPHLHAFLKLCRKINRTTPDFADVDGFHPNIQAPRSVKAVIEYVRKDANYLASEGIAKLISKKTYGSILREATNTQHYLSLVEEHFPRDAALNYERLKMYAEAKFSEPVPTYRSPYRTEDFPNVLDQMTNWATESLPHPRPNPQVNIHALRELRKPEWNLLWG